MSQPGRRIRLLDIRALPMSPTLGLNRDRVVATLTKSITVALTVVAWVSAARASDTLLHGFGYEVRGAKPSAGRTIELKTPPALQITVGGQSVALEQMRLADLVKRLGGAIHSQGDAGDAIDWICYSDAPMGRTLWFASDEMGAGKAVMSSRSLRGMAARKQTAAISLRRR
jgi:hypothetical protein